MDMTVLAVQKVLSGSGRARRLRLMGKYIGHRLVARSEPANTFGLIVHGQITFFPYFDLPYLSARA